MSTFKIDKPLRKKVYQRFWRDLKSIAIKIISNHLFHAFLECPVKTLIPNPSQPLKENRMMPVEIREMP